MVAVVGRIVDEGIAAVLGLLAPDLASGGDDARNPGDVAPGVAFIGGERGAGPFPDRNRHPILAVIDGGRFPAAHPSVGTLEKSAPLALLLPPLHRLERIGEQSVASRDEARIRRMLVIMHGHRRRAGGEGIGRVLFVPTWRLGDFVALQARVRVAAQVVGVVFDEIDRPVGAVGMDFAHDPADPAGAVGAGRSAIEGADQQASVGGRVEAHALMHDRHAGFAGGIPERGHIEVINGKHFLALAPRAAIGRGGDQGMAGRDLFAVGVAQPVEIELAVPIAEIIGA